MVHIGILIDLLLMIFMGACISGLPLHAMHEITDLSKKCKEEEIVVGRVKRELTVELQQELNNALKRAVYKNDVVAAERALQAGAQVNCSNDKRPLIVYVVDITHSSAMADLLLRYGANVNEPVSRAAHLLYEAASRANCGELIKILLTYHADTSMKTPGSGYTALHRVLVDSASESPVEIVTNGMMLIFAGADLYAKDAAGKIPFDCMGDNQDSRQLIVDALEIRTQAYTDLDVLKLIVEEKVIQQSTGILLDLALIIVDYAVPYYKDNSQEGYQDAYDILNQYVLEKWLSIKK